MNLFDLTGKVAIVTGASAGGLGYSLAVALAEAGADVAVCDLAPREGDLETTARAIRNLGRRTCTCLFDVTDAPAVERAVRGTADAWGRLDVVVSNAGIALPKPALEVDEREWHMLLDVNLTGTWLVDRAAGRLMVEQRSGKIVNIASQVAAIVRETPHAPYYASKSGVLNLTRALAAEWGRSGVNVNAIAPGVFYPTNISRRGRAEDPQRLERSANRTMLGRVGNAAEDLKGAVVFLASAASDYVTGHILYVDGGWTAW